MLSEGSSQIVSLFEIEEPYSWIPSFNFCSVSMPWAVVIKIPERPIDLLLKEQNKYWIGETHNE